MTTCASCGRYIDPIEKPLAAPGFAGECGDATYGSMYCEDCYNQLQNNQQLIGCCTVNDQVTKEMI